jgi:hypothetical protein
VGRGGLQGRKDQKRGHTEREYKEEQTRAPFPETIKTKAKLLMMYEYPSSAHYLSMNVNEGIDDEKAQGGES